ncbi:MAG: AMP-binding protein [Alphaproteobacteria bacterium]|nr:AMP-binding protein [Alphaproteobacteria bacterium]
MSEATAASGAAAGPTPLELRRLLKGARLLVMGGTGFLGKVWLSMLLTYFPEIDHVYLVVRPRKGKDGAIKTDSEARYWSQIVPSAVFDPVRELHPGARYDAYMREKVTPIPGDVSEPFAGVPQEVRDQLRGTLTALVNSAGVVSFNPPLDYGLQANAFGMQNLVALARDLGNIPFLHTSTCYVAGDRTGQVDELDPRTFPFPRADELPVEHWDPAREIAECVDLVEHVRHRSDDAFRQTDFIDQARKNLIAKGEPARGSALEDELEKVKRRFEEQRLVDAGTERAKYWGWHNIYTYTKSIGEQILCASGLPFTIARPAVIESAVSFPSTGWAEGINTSAPLIYLGIRTAGSYPARPDSVLDVIPVDMVAAGMMLSLGELLEGNPQVVYQYGSSDTSPLLMYRFIELTGLRRRQWLLNEKGGNPLANWMQARFESTPITTEQYFERGPDFWADTADSASSLLKKVGVGPLAPLVKPARGGLKSLSKGMRVKKKILDQFVPFMATHSYRFSCANTRAAYDRLVDEEKAFICWRPETIDWRHYLLEVHIPGLEAHVLPEIDERMQRPVKPLRPHDTLLDFLDEVAERHDLAPALLRAQDEGFSRISYREMRERAHAAAQRLIDAGVSQGDRVVLSGQNHPDWAIAYFGILRAGGIAVPLDPALAPEQAANVAATASTRAAVLDAKARAGFGEVLVGPQLDLHAAAAAGPTDRLPPQSARPSDVASILFTSGTTGVPKGVMLSNENFCTLLSSLGRIFELRESDRVLSVLPLHHTFEFTCGLLLPLSRGARVLYLDEINGERLTWGLREGRVTGMVGVPALWQLLERRIRSQVRERGDLFETVFDAGLEINRWVGKTTGLDAGRLFFGSVHDRLGGNIRFLISGGAALPKGTHQLFSGVGLHLAEGYGLTEAAPVLSVAKGYPGAKAGTVGSAIPGVELKILDPDGDGVGEVVARGPNVMQGYYGNREATEAVLDADGWLHTGDLGRLDHKGRLSLVGRAKEVVVTSSGENIYLDDVENALGELRYVKEFSLVGLDDPRGGERLGMLAVPEDTRKPGATAIDRHTLHARAKESIRDRVAKLPKVQRPAVIHLVDADLPRTATRKVKRKEVRQVLERIVAASTTGVQRGESLAGPVVDAIAAVAGVSAAGVTENTNLGDELGFDSLMWVELASALESMGHGQPDADRLARCETVAEVIALVNAPRPQIVKEADVRDSVHIPKVVARPMKDALGWVQREIYGTGLHTTVIGRGFIPQNRQTLVVSNHCSHLDMGLVKFALGPYGQRLVALAAKDYFFEGNPWVVAYFEQLTNLRPIDRKRGFRASLQQAREVIDQGNVALVFPEGTRRTDGVIGEFKPLVGWLALDTGVDILPMHLEGTFEALPKGAVLPRKRDVTVRIGPPLQSRDLLRLTEGMKRSEAARRVAQLSQMAVEALRDGGVLDLTAMADATQVEARKDPVELLQEAFGTLEGRFDPGRVEKPVCWYFSLGGKEGPRFTVQVDGASARVSSGRPQGGAADCVVKTSVDLMRKIIMDKYVPDPSEFISGALKTNDIPLLIEFSRVFQLSEVSL